MTATNREVCRWEIRKAQEQFRNWRASKQGHERIPPRLWEIAVRLCKTSSVRRVATWLRLNHASLRSEVVRRSGRGGRTPAFVEWGLPAGALPEASSAEYVVELAGQGTRQLRVHVRGASAAEVSRLVEALSVGGGQKATP